MIQWLSTVAYTQQDKSRLVIQTASSQKHEESIQLKLECFARYFDVWLLLYLLLSILFQKLFYYTIYKEKYYSFETFILWFPSFLSHCVFKSFAKYFDKIFLRECNHCYIKLYNCGAIFLLFSVTILSISYMIKNYVQ